MYAQRIKEFVEANFIPEPNSGCWLWTAGCLVNGGYGYLYIDGVQHRAHRISYELFCGSIPDGLIVRHKCDVTCCVNPQHLILGTDWDNSQDKIARQRVVGFKAGSNHPNTIITEQDVRDIRYKATIMSQQLVADEYGMTQAAISKIVRKVTWSHVN